MEICQSLTTIQLLGVLVAVGLGFWGCSRSGGQGQTAVATGFAITSTVLQPGQPIPRQYTADGANVSPPLEIANVPAGTKELVLIVDDPDAPAGTWDHWLLYRIPADQRSLPEGLSAGRSGAHPANMLEGVNSWGKPGYEGPEPPAGKPHRYYFKLYALSAPLGAPAGLTKKDLVKAMEGKILAGTELMGTYQRKR